MVASMSVAVLWHDGEITAGKDATDVLRQLLGGWNPNTVAELRDVLARRSLINVDDARKLNDDEFLQLLDCKGTLTYQQIVLR
jgi:hypothetical protein